MGTPEFAVPSLKALIEAGHDLLAVVTQPDRPRGRGREPSPSPVKAVAVEHGIRVLTPTKLRDAAFAAELRAMGPEFVVVVAYGRLLPQSVLDVPAGGCINLHASLLPAYRGAAPINRAIINGDRETGVCTMLMDTGLDTGPVLLERKVPIGDDDTARDLAVKLSNEGALLLKETIAQLIEGGLTPRPQDDSRATFAPMLKKEDGRIDWSKGSEEIRNLMRGLYPWPGAYTQWQGKGVVKIHSARSHTGPGVDAVAPPGTIIDVKGDTIDVACGKGVLRITELQPENKRRMSAGEFISGYRICKGERFI